MYAMPTIVPSCARAHDAAHSKMDSQEEHSGANHEGSGEPRLLPANNTIPSQNHLTPALQLLLQLGRFLSLNTKYILPIRLFFKQNILIFN